MAHGYKSDLSTLRKRFSVSQHGVNLKQLIDMASRMKLASRALQLELHEVDRLQLPQLLPVGHY